MKEDYLIPTVIGNKYFCYLGCRSLWLSKAGILKHYVDEHYDYEDAQKLWKWGLNVEVMQNLLRLRELQPLKISKAQQE